MKLGIGKRRGLLECSTARGVFAILALDQRSSLRKAMNPADPEGVSYERLVSFKQRLIKGLAPETSAVLLDPEYGAAQNISQDNIPAQTGLIIALEETGYTGERTKRRSKILADWSVKKAQMIGASGIKLLVYYHPESDVAEHQRDLIREVAEACSHQDVAFFLEPINYAIDPEKPKLTPTERRKVAIQTADELSQLGADVLKLAFPIDCEAEPDEKIWLEACQEVSDACQVPWVLLSAGVDFELYIKQVIAACREGASGVMAGRAVWKEAVGLGPSAKKSFIEETAITRFRKLQSVCDGLARPWGSFYPSQSIPDGWYVNYPAN